MIEVSGIRVPLNRLDGDERHELATVREATLRKLHLTPGDVTAFELRKRSVDARKKSDILLTYTARLQLAGRTNAERQLLQRLKRRRADRGVCVVDEVVYRLPVAAHAPSDLRPIVVGAGCAGLFCALALAEAGLAPLLVERGDDATRRTAAVAHLNQTGELDPESNIQFGLGGAGTFSDGKLNTGTKSPAHRFILEALASAGAAQHILWDAKPHVGSDVLPRVVERLVKRIEAAGGEVRCRTRMTGLDVTGGKVRSVTLESRDPQTGVLREERIATNQVVLATGHSARDVFELLRDANVTLERKTFAMGVRIEHLQADIDRAQYGPSAGHPALGAAPYKLAQHLEDGRGAFSFCMCPGGFVVAAASEPGGVVTNGMSLSDRAGTNANSGLLANVFPTDLPGDDVLAGITLQRSCEQAAFEAGDGSFVAPAQLVGDFMQGVPSMGAGRIQPTYPRGVRWGAVDSCLPTYVTDALRTAIPRMERQLRGFSAADAVLTGVESRSSSPVRVTRDESGQALGIAGLFPCGEGAGYAGGIMSAATDGLRTAGWLIESLSSLHA